MGVHPALIRQVYKEGSQGGCALAIPIATCEALGHPLMGGSYIEETPRGGQHHIEIDGGVVPLLESWDIIRNP